MSWLKKLNFFKKNDSGFTLAEVMIAAGMVAVISVTLMRVMSTASKSTKKITVDMAIQEVHTDIKNILRNQNACNAVFATKGIAPFELALPSPIPAGLHAQKIYEIKRYKGLDNTAYDAYADYENRAPLPAAIGENTSSRFWIKSMVGADADVDVATKSGKITLYITYSRVDPSETATLQEKKKKNKTYGGLTKRMSIDVFVNLDPSDTTKILDCNADLADYQSAFCESGLNGKWDGTNCLSVQIGQDATLPTPLRNVGIETTSAWIYEGLQIGSSTSGSTPPVEPSVTPPGGLGVDMPAPGAGNVSMAGDLSVGLEGLPSDPPINGNIVAWGDLTLGKEDQTGNLLMYGDLDTKGTARIQKSIGVGVDPQYDTAVPDIGTGNIDLEGNIASTGELNIYSNRAALGLPRINLNSSVVTVDGPNDVSLHSSGNITISGSLNSTAYPLTTNKNYAATREWVDTYLKDGIAANAGLDSLIGEMISRMSTYASDQPMDAVSFYTCGKMRLSSQYNTVGPTGGCNFALPTCDRSGKCTRVCIGTDCRTSWPVDTNTMCNGSAYCNSVCIRNVCRTSWPQYRSNYSCVRRSYSCANYEVMHGLYYSYSTARPICCRLMIR